MPGYGIVTSTDGLLPWSWAAERLERSHDFWLATVCPDGRPHVMPVWGVWDGASLWFSTGARSRKARNLARDPRATMTTVDAAEPVIVEGTVHLIRERAAVEEFAARVNAKYDSDYAVDFFLAEATLRLAPVAAFGLRQDDFTGSPTRWRFGPGR
jgi:PPOX class probable F420-dependent enzyme